MKKLARYLLLLAAMGLGFAFASCKADDDDDTTYYTVSFNSDGGTEVKSQKVESGKKATKPADPTKQAIATETYAFENWYTSTDNGTTLSDTAFDFNTPITKDITLYAKWATNVVTHTVTFDSKNGSTAEIKTVNHGNKVERPTNPTKAATEAETYAFDNWYTSTDGGETLSETAFNFDTAIDKDITLYAKWTATAIHTVTFNTNGGTEVTSQKVESGKKATKPAAPTKQETATEAFAFDNWYTSTDGGATLSETAFDFDTAIEADITLYAKWKEADYIILKNCSEIRKMFETLCKYSNFEFQKTITHFAKADEKPSSADYYLDAAENRIPLWYDEAVKTLYYYLEPGKKMSLRTSYGRNELFASMKDATSIETKDFDTSNVTSMDYMFAGCRKLTSLDVSKFDTSNVTDMASMFSGCQALTSLDVSKFDTSNVTDMPLMFSDCFALTSLDVSKFDTSNVTNMGSMFNNCIALTSLDVSKFNTSNVTDMSWMFSVCNALTSLDVSKFDTSKVTNMGGIFHRCNALTSLDVSKFDTSNVTNMFKMFYECSSLTTIFASDKFVTNGVTSDSDMFSSSSKLQGGAGTVYDVNHINKEYARIDGGTENPGYFTTKTN